MSLEIWLTIFNLCGTGGLWFFVIPLRGLRKDLEVETQRRLDEKFSVAEKRFDSYSNRIRALELGQVSASGDAFKIFWTRGDHERTETKRDRQFELVNEKLDETIREIERLKASV